MKRTSKAALGAGVGLAAAAAVGAYLLYGPQGSKNRRVAKAWMRKAKGELVREVKKLKVVTKAAYHQAVRRALARYRQMKGIDRKDVAIFMNEAAKRWVVVKKHAEKAMKAAAKRSRR